MATFGTFALLYTVTESWILPYTPNANQSFLRSLLDLALPFMMAYLLLFFIIFGLLQSLSSDIVLADQHDMQSVFATVSLNYPSQYIYNIPLMNPIDASKALRIGNSTKTGGTQRPRTSSPANGISQCTLSCSSTYMRPRSCEGPRKQKRCSSRSCSARVRMSSSWWS